MIENTAVITISDQTYRVGFDDGCIVISSGSEKTDKQVWLSKEMIYWLDKNYEGLSSFKFTDQKLNTLEE